MEMQEGMESPLYKAAEQVLEKDNWMGLIKPGDKIINVVKLEPMASGSRRFKYPDPTKLSVAAYKAKRFAVFCEDIRIVKVKLSKVDKKTRSGTHIVNEWDSEWELCKEDFSQITQMMHYEDDLVNGRLADIDGSVMEQELAPAGDMFVESDSESDIAAD